MDYKTLRKRMVEEQLILRGIHDENVLNAFYTVERHRFVPKKSQKIAYADFPLSIGENQTISQPYIVAIMTECLHITKNDTVLEVGTGSGYQTAILAELANKVYSIERLNTLAKNASLLLSILGYTNIDILTGDGSSGWEEKAPFDKIIVTAAAPVIPKPLTDQLKNNGKLILPLGDKSYQELILVSKINSRLESKKICDCIFVPLIGKFAN